MIADSYMGPTPQEENSPRNSDVVIPLREIERPEFTRKRLNRRFSVAEFGQAIRGGPSKLL